MVLCCHLRRIIYKIREVVFEPSNMTRCIAKMYTPSGTSWPQFYGSGCLVSFFNASENISYLCKKWMADKKVGKRIRLNSMQKQLHTFCTCAYLQKHTTVKQFSAQKVICSNQPPVKNKNYGYHNISSCLNILWPNESKMLAKKIWTLFFTNAFFKQQNIESLL